MFQRTQLLVSCALGALLVSAGAAAAQTTDETTPIAAARVETVTATADATATDTATDQSTTTSQVGELMVTARLRTENVQKVPEDIVAVTPEVLQDNQITNFYDLQGFAPSLDVNTNSNKEFSSILIRGFATATFVAEAPAIPYSLYDMGDIQILYGPQGTLFGYTALGGAVLYDPNHPKMNTFGAGLDLTVGNLNEVNVTGYVNIPLVNDHLALRIAAERDHTDGYTAVEGSSLKLDGNGIEGARIELQWNPLGGRFTDFSMLELDHQDNTPTDRLAAFINPIIVPNQCGGTNSQDPTGATGPGTSVECYTATGYPEPLARALSFYAADCTQGVLNALWTPGTTTAQCEQQHMAVAMTFAGNANAALALAQATHGRVEDMPIENSPLTQLSDNILYDNIANYDVVHWSGLFGGGDIYVHNISSVLWYRNLFSNQSIGEAGSYSGNSLSYAAASGASAYLCAAGQVSNDFPLYNPTLVPGTTTPPSNGLCPSTLGEYNIDYTDELQIHGTLDTALGASPGVTWVLGVYASGYPKPIDDTSQNVILALYGNATVNEGPTPQGTFPDGGWSAYWGEYFQATADFGMLWKPLTGLHLTGGIRFNENRSSAYNAPVVTNVPAATTLTTGASATEPCTAQPTTSPFPLSTACQYYFYGNYAAPTHTLSVTRPVNWSEELDYTTKDLLLYQEIQYIIVPGFANAPIPSNIPASDVPGYQPFAADEDLTDYEVGAKWNFHFDNGVRGYLDADLYDEDLAHVQLNQVLQIPANGSTIVNQTVVTFTRNPANLIKKGVEFQGEVFPVPDLDIYANFSYADDYYTDYFVNDPNAFVYPVCAGGTGAALTSPGSYTAAQLAAEPGACTAWLTGPAGAPQPYFPSNLAVGQGISSTGTLQYSTAPGAVNSPLCDPAHSAATVAPGNTVGTCIMNLSGTRVPYAPYVQANLSIKYTFHLGDNVGDVVPSFSVRYTSQQNFTATRPLIRYQEIFGNAIAEGWEQGPTAIVNARLDWRNPLGQKNMDVAAWVTNLFDTAYAVGAIDDNVTAGVTTRTMAPPRQFGIEISDKW